jgi:predicted Zn-dependent protease
LVLFDGALALEPNWALIHIDRAAALVNLNRPDEAEIASRRALRLEPNSAAASYMLGCAMLMQEKITPETAAYLAVAAGKYPKAQSYMAGVKEYLAASGPGR